MLFGLHPQMVFAAYWLLMIVLSAFFLRMACGLCRTTLPSWRRSIIAVIVVTFLSYLAFDFTAYLILRTMQDVVTQVPPGYGYNIWFREPISTKLHVIGMAGPLRYTAYVFGLCAAGVLQVIVLQLEVTFRIGLGIAALQWAATLVAGYILALVFGVAISASSFQLPVAQAAKGAEKGKASAKGAATPKGRMTAQKTDKGKTETTPETKSKDEAATDSADPLQHTLHLIQHEVEGAVNDPKATMDYAVTNIKAYGDSHLEELKEDLEPLTRYLPEPVQNFLNKGGWWAVLGVIGVVAVIWLISLFRRMLRALTRPRRPKKRKKRQAGFSLKENLAKLGDSFTEEGPQRVTVEGLPGRLRLVVLSARTRTSGELSEEMADRVLDWIKPGLAGVTAQDYPGVRVWPPFYSNDGFATAFAANVAIPEPKGQKSHWVLVTGQVKMGKALLHVGLVFHTDEPNALRNLFVKSERWQRVVGVKENRATAAAR